MHNMRIPVYAHERKGKVTEVYTGHVDDFRVFRHDEDTTTVLQGVTHLFILEFV